MPVLEDIAGNCLGCRGASLSAHADGCPGCYVHLPRKVGELSAAGSEPAEFGGRGLLVRLLRVFCGNSRKTICSAIFWLIFLNVLTYAEANNSKNRFWFCLRSK